MTASRTSETVAHLMARLRSGDHEAADRLVELFYPELKHLAAAKMTAEGSEHSWQATLLVHELYLKLVKLRTLSPPERTGDSEREHFLRFAGHLMRHLLIDHSRPLVRRSTRIDIASIDMLDEAGGQASLHEIDDLLEQLAAIQPRLRSIVEMKVFEGLSVEEIAIRLQVAPRTVARNWAFCKQWLQDQFRGDGK